MKSCLMPMAMAAPKKMAGAQIKKAMATPAEIRFLATAFEFVARCQLLR